jgi:hypothetical protein
VAGGGTAKAKGGPSGGGGGNLPGDTLPTIMWAVPIHSTCLQKRLKVPLPDTPMLVSVDVSYVAPQVHRIVNVPLHREYSLGIIFIFSQGMMDLYHI